MSELFLSSEQLFQESFERVKEKVSDNTCQIKGKY